MIAIYQHLYSEFLRLKQRVDELERELLRLREESSQKVGSIAYHIENLYVESIQNGVLDLGVHMGNEMDKRIQSSGPISTDGAPKSESDRLNRLVEEVREAQGHLHEVDLRLKQLEARIQQVEGRIQDLEDLHV